MRITDTRTIFILSIVLAFIVPQFSVYTTGILVPILILMMTFSIKGIGFRHLGHVNKGTIIRLVAGNYIILTALYMLSAYFFLDPIYHDAIFVYALMPPAVGIISLSYILKGDIKVSFIAEFFGYCMSIVIVPILSYLVFGDAISPAHILQVLFYVIIVPFILSRVLHHFETKEKKIPDTVTDLVINLAYGIAFYTIIGSNRDAFFNIYSLIPMMILFFILKFGVGTVVFFALRKRITKEIDVLYVLFMTMKNGGAAVAIIILLFGVDASLPMAIHSIIVPFYIVYLEWLIPAFGIQTKG